MSALTYDAILIASFGGPEGPDEVMPFLEAVTAGRNIPRARLDVVAEHYHHFGGVSPINARTAELAAALADELTAHGPALPVYWGNRFWRPHLDAVVREMKDAGVRRALAVVTSAFSSPSGCLAYRAALDAACAAIGEDAPVIDKIRPFWDHPGYVDVCVRRLEDALESLPEAQRPGAHVFFTAHSIPTSMAASCPYVDQLEEHIRLVTERAGLTRYRLVYQSRSGSPRVAWLEPDVLDALATLERGETVVVAPFGFVADHMEVVWDLDEEARQVAEERGLTFVRAATANAHPIFVRALRDLVAERVDGGDARASLAVGGALPDRCPPGCCQR